MRAETRASRRATAAAVPVPIAVVAASSPLLAPADSPTRARPPASAPVVSTSEQAPGGSARRIAAALAAGNDVGVLAAAGGGEPLRSTTAQGLARCIDLGDPDRLWVVVDKVRPFVPVDFVPAGLQVVGGLGGPQGETLRSDAANALAAMAAASVAAGAGQIGLGSGFRSFATQVDTYDSLVAEMGDAAEAATARPGFSEHQSGLAGDLVPCDANGCATLDDLAASPQGAWILANAAQFGWIVRYTQQGRPVTGYESEPWHLRYIGVDLATAYAAGGWTSLEEFFGLPAAPDYLQ